MTTTAAAADGGVRTLEDLGDLTGNGRFREFADALLICGALGFPFLAAQDHAVGASVCADDDVELARSSLEAAGGTRAELQLPIDLVLGGRLAADAQMREVSPSSAAATRWRRLKNGP